MKYLVIIILALSLTACDNGEEKMTKEEVLEEYEGSANMSDVKVVDTAGINMVKDTLPVIIKEKEEIEN